MKLIGLNGRKWSGKDAAFLILEQIIRQAGGKAQRICFADKMKYSGMCALGFDPANSVADMVAMADDLKENGFVTTSWKDHDVMVKRTVPGRVFWQLYGTEAHRDVFGEEFWVDALLPHPFDGDRELVKLDTLFPDADVLIETTTRFQNEADRILDLGGEVWHIDADKRLGPLSPDAHVSERGLPPEYVTLTVPNNGTAEQFEIALAAAWSLSKNV